MGSRYKGK